MENLFFGKFRLASTKEMTGERRISLIIRTVRLFILLRTLFELSGQISIVDGRQYSGYEYGTRSLGSAYLDPSSSSETPYFDDISPRNVTSVVDETAILKCRVKNKGNRTVSWMRKRDLHILTTNIYTYTGDQRFSVLHTPGTDDWHLKIEYAQQRDTGIYECQVNTEPKINLAIFLEVTAEPTSQLNLHPQFYGTKAARAKILGSQEVHVKRESTISITCSVNIHASSVLWYHGSQIVDFDSIRGGISLETEKTEQGTSSRLMLTRATFRDSGNYTCVPAAAIPASVVIHVLNGEHPAAMQTSESNVMPRRYLGPSSNFVIFVNLTILFGLSKRFSHIISSGSSSLAAMEIR